MAEMFTRAAGYSGPIPVDVHLGEPVNVDVFGLDSFQITCRPDILPVDGPSAFAPLRINLAATRATWVPVRTVAPAGYYVLTYVSGAANVYNDDLAPPVGTAALRLEGISGVGRLLVEGSRELLWLEPLAPAFAGPHTLEWNRGLAGPCSFEDFNLLLDEVGNLLVAENNDNILIESDLFGPTNRIWINAGSKFYTIGEPAFSSLGYPTAEAAERAAAGQQVVFYHPGGKLQVCYDGDPVVGPAQGSILVEISSGLSHLAEWAIVSSTSTPPPVVRAGETHAPMPHVDGITPGLHCLQLRVGSVTQEYWLWVWRSSPNGSPPGSVAYSTASRDAYRPQRSAMLGSAQPMPWEIFPARPAKSGGNKVGSPLINRQYLEQQNAFAGNTVEKPQTAGSLPTEPTVLGSGVAF